MTLPSGVTASGLISASEQSPSMNTRYRRIRMSAACAACLASGNSGRMRLRAMYGRMPSSGTCAFTMRSGVLWATSSMSTPPSDDSMTSGALRSRSMTIAQ